MGKAWGPDPGSREISVTLHSSRPLPHHQGTLLLPEFPETWPKFLNDFLQGKGCIMSSPWQKVLKQYIANPCHLLEFKDKRKTNKQDTQFSISRFLSILIDRKALFRSRKPYPNIVCMCVSCSVMSDSLRSHGLQSTRLLCPWSSPVKNMEWVAISFSRGSSWHRDRTWDSCIADRFFTVWATLEAQSQHWDTCE